MSSPTNKELATYLAVDNLQKLDREFGNIDKVKLSNYLGIIMHGKPTIKEVAHAYIIWGLIASVENFRKCNDPRNLISLAEVKGGHKNFKMTTVRMRSVELDYETNIKRIITHYTEYMTSRGYENIGNLMKNFVPKEPESIAPVGMVRYGRDGSPVGTNNKMCVKISDMVEKYVKRGVKIFDPYLNNLHKQRGKIK